MKRKYYSHSVQLLIKMVREMRFFQYTAVSILLLFICGCENISGFLRQSKAPARASKKEIINQGEELLLKADDLYIKKQFGAALETYKKILVFDPENQKAIFRIKEIQNWVPLINKRESVIKKRLDLSAKIKNEELRRTKEEKKKLKEKIAREEKEKKQLLKKMTSLNSLSNALNALSEHDFEKARLYTKKAMMGYPESEEIISFWNKISYIEDEWDALMKIKKEEEKQKKHEKKKKKLKAQIEKAIEQYEDPFKKEAEIFQHKLDERVERKSKSDLEKIVDREFAFKNILSQNKQVKAVELEFLREQSLIVFNKAIKEYEKDEKDGILENFNDKELKLYQEGIAESYYWIGMFYDSKYQNKKALKFFEKIKEKFPDSIFYHPALYQIGLNYMKINQLSLSYEAFELVIDTPFPEDGGLSHFEGWVDKDPMLGAEELRKKSFLKMAEIRKQKKEYDFAIEIFENLETEYNKDEDFLDEIIINKGHIYLESGEYDRAYKIYEKLVVKGRKGKQFDRALFYRAKTLISRGDFDEARKKLEDIFLYDPLNNQRIAATYLFGETYFIEGDYSKAIVHIRKALEEFPKYKNIGRYKLILGQSYSYLGLHESAIEVLEEIINEYKDESFVPESYFFLAKTYFKISRYQNARRILLELGDIFSRHEFSKKGKYLLGEIYMKEKKYSRAEKQYRIAYINSPSGVMAFQSIYYRAKCLREMGKNTLLKKYFKDMVERKNLNRNTWDNEANSQRADYLKFYYKIIFEYGDFLFSLKEYDKAIIVLERVGNEYPEGEDLAWSLYLIAKSYELKNDSKNAILKYQNVVSSSPESFWGQQAQYNMNQLIWNEKNYQKAIEISGGYSERGTN